MESRDNEIVRLRIALLVACAFAAALTTAIALAATTVPTEIQLPGSQPGEVSQIESVSKCDNCHGNFDPGGEPWFNWSGSMMAHAARDPIFWATVAVAEQDFDGSGDLCIRCHSPEGWLGGRSTPTDGSGLAAGDDEGIQCDVCHRLTNPDDSEHLGQQSQPFVANDGGAPATGFYGSGMYSVWNGNAKLGPYADADARHQFLQSQFHRSGELCGTCHDVSNPAVGDLAHNNGAQTPLDPNDFSGVPGSPVGEKAAFKNFPYKYGVVERTYSEWKGSLWPQTLVSSYSTLPSDLQAGAIQSAHQAALLAGNGGDYADGTPRFFTCQSCHMRPTIGQGCNKNPPVRNDLPLHDLTGGNNWGPDAIQYLDGLGQLILGGGLSVDQVSALNAGKIRAEQTLSGAASLDVVGNRVKVINLTGHKLISGYPEGRRMWLDVRWYDAADTLLAEDGAYGTVMSTIDGVPTSVQTLLDLDPVFTRIYEAHAAMTQEWANQLLGLGYDPNLPLSYDRKTGSVTRTLGQLSLQPDGSYRETFHFVLNNHLAKDSRIPPYGLSFDSVLERNTRPVPADQYGNPGPGGVYDYWDEVVLNPPPGADHATVELRYQPTSWEYIQFLHLANEGVGPLGAEGDKILDAWLNTGMAAPYTMAQTTWSQTLAACSDSLDNDRDGVSDYPLDPGCTSASDESESSPALACDDRVDNDGDEAMDYPRDPGCLSLTASSEVYDDGDGVSDGMDNCPFVANAPQTDSNFDDRGDACECGDANDDGKPDASDAAHLRAALVRLVAGVNAPDKCNVHGPTNIVDSDGDGLPDDCNVLDVVVLARSSADLGPGLSQVCDAAVP